ncbi:MAG: sulfatase-like hydrolase/transferase [Spirochaetes bacterium]|nr:sulfatase-like hydrolase/transferase [Spirochaetota bacterium]
MKQSKPNIIFILSDQQRWDTLGCYGQKLEVTPNLDIMASEGVRFEYAFTCQPVCGPARACLQTGKYATETGCYRNNIALPSNEKTLAHYLAEAGYETGYIGKWHLASDGDSLTGDNAEVNELNFNKRAVPPERRGGYDDYWLASDVLEFTSHGYDGYMFNRDMQKVEFKGYRVDCLTDFALEYLTSRVNERPFFLFLSYIEPHHQNDHHRYEGPIGSVDRFKDFKAPGDLAGSTGDWPEQYPDYLGCCASLDHNTGRIIKALKHLGLADNTIVIYTSDHGSHFRTRNKFLEYGNYDDYKRSCHEASIHIPLIIQPGFKGGKTVNELVSLIDLPPTILRCAGIEKPESMHGGCLQELVNGKADNWPQEVFIQISESKVGRAIRTKRWKYSVCAPGVNGFIYSGSNYYREDCLYDLDNDPHELNNLVRDISTSAVRRNLSRLLMSYIRRIESRTVKITE